MTYTTLTLTFFVLIALYWNVDSIEKRQMTRLETKCKQNKNYTYLRYRNAEKCMIWMGKDLLYLDAVKSCQEQGALLGTFKTQSELTILRQFAKDTIVWVGLDKINKPTFTWIDDGKQVCQHQQT
ncbi:uncharacterized protein LOC129921849 isoform X2 [Biomphalaria glabrata]|uniref:Uncharacterized protein LOC129921849 isoform X2 n=1 Tax=Biomphalaria glabrata TaxID=6526 RepID=A0A9W2YDY1_BIOGL|nr:uncharacterized protein LOC129921849 isoform X2 [Biomphalaria glabrata]